MKFISLIIFAVAGKLTINSKVSSAQLQYFLQALMIAQVNAGGPSVIDYFCAKDSNGKVIFTNVQDCGGFDCPDGYYQNSNDGYNTCCCRQYGS